MLDFNVVAEGLLRLTNWFGNYPIWFCGMASSMEASFEESYAVRALLHAERVLGIGHIQDVAHTYCDLMVRLQGAHWEDMYDMGYGYDLDKDGMVNCSCVADCSSVARAIIDTVRAYPGYPKNPVYVESLKKFIDYVLNHFVTDTGVIGVGVLSHKVNPMPEYWCANGLFSQTLVSFAELTGETKYYDAAVAPMEFLATYDYRNTEWKEWNISPQMMILYSGEGVLEGLASDVMKSKLDIRPRGVVRGTVRADNPDGAGTVEQAANRVKSDVDILPGGNPAQGQTVYELLKRRWEAFADWLRKNQNVEGLWKSPAGQDYRDYETGLSWLIYRAIEGFGSSPDLEGMVARQLNYLVSQEAKRYFGLFCRPFSTALAYLSFASIAEKLMKRDPECFEKILADERKNIMNALW